jgi:acetate kinase
MLVDRISGFVGSYAVKLDGQVDALIFAGGIGEKSPLLRKAVADKCRSIGVAINQEANNKAPDGEATITDISREPGQKPAVLVCQTDEEVRYVLSSHQFMRPTYRVRY